MSSGDFPAPANDLPQFKSAQVKKKDFGLR